MRKRSALAALGPMAVLAMLMTGCEEVNDAADQVNSAASKANVCAEALGVVNLNPNVDPEQVRAEAEEKANRLRELGERAAQQDLRETLFAMSDGYLELEQRKLDHLNGFNEWLQQNLRNLEQLRQACA